MIHANEGAPPDINATNGSFMLNPSTLSKGNIMAMDRACIDYEKFEQLTQLIANFLLIVMQRVLTRSWSFSGLATMVRISLMCYVDFCSLFNHPEKDWECILGSVSGLPPQPSLFD